jgi:hypothetical protein
MDRLAFGFVFMTGETGGGIGLRVKWNRMFGGRGGSGEQEDNEQIPQDA